MNENLKDNMNSKGKNIVTDRKIVYFMWKTNGNLNGLSSRLLNDKTNTSEIISQRRLLLIFKLYFISVMVTICRQKYLQNVSCR